MYSVVFSSLTSARRISALLTLLCFAGPTLAQGNEGGNSTVVYAADYFRDYAPITAQNMLDRIPGQNAGGGPSGNRGGPPSGFVGNPSSGGRGFGSGDSGSEILINGKRTAGKNNQTRGLLESISAAQVKEIQIIRGTSGTLDVRGSGQVVNVVLFEELTTNSISYQASVDHFQDQETKPGGSISISGQRGSLNYLLSAGSSPRYDNAISRESSILGDFSRNDTVREERTRDQSEDQLSMNLGYDFTASSSMRFNALYAVNDNTTKVDRRINNLRVQPNFLTMELEDIPAAKDNWEIGGDLEQRRANGDRFKVLFIANQDNSEVTRERFKLLNTGVPQKNLYLATNAVTEERIVRGSYTMELMSGQDLEFGVERAQTILDSQLALGLLSATGAPSASVGGLVPQLVENANSRVEEIRYEPFVIHNWILNPRMSLETTLLYESSEITQTGDVRNQRDFSFVKPKIDFRFDVTPSLQLRGTLEKVVNQLSFADFVAANDDQDNDTSTQAGNAQLRQQWLWKYNFNTEYRLPNDVGVLSSDFFYFDHHDIIDRMDVSTSPTNLQSANGNIGDGWEYGMHLNASIRMGMIRLPNVLVTSAFNLQDSEVTDPFLGIDRRFQFYQRGRFTFAFRHDLPALRFNWGMQYFDRVDGGMKRYDIDDIEFSVGEPRVNLFAETVDTRGLTYRFDAGGLTDGTQCRERTRFIGRISAGILEEIEDQCTTNGVVLTFKVNGTF